MVGPCADTLLAGGRLNDEVFIDGRSESRRELGDEARVHSQLALVTPDSERAW